MKFLGHNYDHGWALLILELYSTEKNLVIYFIIYSKYMDLVLLSSTCSSTCYGNNEETDREDPCFQELSSLERGFENL